MSPLFTTREAEASLGAFTREFGEKMADFAGHAAMPAILSGELVHLLRINYFLDPPLDLPYEAEANLLLSRLCTEIDDGLFAIDPALRDLLLRQLIARHDGKRVRDVARLLWEYNGRGTPWGDSPGLLEAQQLTALNFIDPNRALSWLTRARHGEGASPVGDERWFVALERDMLARTAAISVEPPSLIDGLPAFRELWDALVAARADPNAALRIAGSLGIAAPPSAAELGAASVWRFILEAAWRANQIPDLLDLVSTDVGQSKTWIDAVREFWINTSPALRIENGTFAKAPPEWEILDRHRAALERSIRATVLLVIETPTEGPQVFGLGTLVGRHAVISHSSTVQKALSWGFGPNMPTRVFAEFVDDHPAFGYTTGVERRLELTDAVVDQPTQLVALAPDPNTSLFSFPPPLRVLTDEPSPLKGRKVCIVGYPMEDSRIDSQVVARVLGKADGVLRLMPGEILNEDTRQGVLIHNCFSTGGTGGSALIDVETGDVLGVHFATTYDPSSLGLKQGHAISTLRLAYDGGLLRAGVFDTPGPATSAPVMQRFSGNNAQALAIFLQLLDRRERLVLVEGADVRARSNLIAELAKAAREHECRSVTCVSPNPNDASWDIAALVVSLARALNIELRPRGSAESLDEWAAGTMNSLRQEVLRLPTLLFIDGFDMSHAQGLALSFALAYLRDQLRMVVIAGENLDRLAPPGFDVVNVIAFEPSAQTTESPALPTPTGQLRVLVVGTGWIDLPKPVQLAARSVGEAIARAGCTLVTGGWPGVDHLAARAFSSALGTGSARLPTDLIQILENDQQPDFRGEATMVRVVHNHRSLEALKLADAVVLIGGAGGTWEAFRSALAAKKIAIPLFNTGTDARRAAILLEILGQNVSTRLLRMEFADEEKARQSGRLFETLLTQLDPDPTTHLDNRNLLWVTETLLPLAQNYLRKSAGFDEEAARIFQECAASDLPPAQYGRFVDALLDEADPVWRCTAYLAIEARIQERFVIPVINNGVRELGLALDQRETRPLWRWLAAIRRLLDSYPVAFPSDLVGTLQNAVRAIAAREDVDPGGECKRALHEILDILQKQPAKNSVPETVEDLVNALAETDPRTWNTIAEQIQKFSATAIPALEKALNDEREEMRQAVIQVLEYLGPQFPEGIPLLAAALGDKSSSVRYQAAESLRGFGPSAAPAIQALISAFHDHDRLVRQAAAEALGAIGPAAGEALRALQGGLFDKSELVRAKSAAAMQKIDPRISNPYASSPSTAKEQAGDAEPKQEDADSASLGEAWALSGSIDFPFRQVIEPIAYSRIPSRGGYVSQRGQSYALSGVVSTAAHFSQVAHQDEKDKGRITTVTSVIERLNVADILTADRVVAQIAIDHARDAMPDVTFLGTRFENLRIVGKPVLVEFDFDIARKFNRVGSPQPSSLISIVTADPSDYRIVANRIDVPGFGEISIADLTIGTGTIQLTMITCQFSKLLRGSLQVATCRVNVAL